MIPKLSFIALSLFCACAVLGAEQLTEQEIETQRMKDGIEIVRFDLPARGSTSAVVEVNNTTDSDFRWGHNDMAPVNQIGEMGEVNDAVSMNAIEPVTTHMTIPAHRKKLYAVRYTCPSTKPIAFIWRR